MIWWSSLKQEQKKMAANLSTLSLFNVIKNLVHIAITFLGGEHNPDHLLNDSESKPSDRSVPTTFNQSHTAGNKTLSFDGAK